MGLYASFTPEDLGYPTTLSQAVEDDVIEVDVDYSDACDAFCDVFLDTATSLVPVDTGYLQSTISTTTDGFFCEAEATAEYAQYVEYGTWKMAAQPYFEPAIYEGLMAFNEEAQTALDDAKDELMNACEEAAASSANSDFFEEDGFFPSVGNLLIGGILFLLLFPLLVNLYGIIDTIFGTFSKNKYNNLGEELAQSGVEIIIT